jgi:hypothetical protein
MSICMTSPAPQPPRRTDFMKTNEQKAKRLAKAIFALGHNGPQSRCFRIEFKSWDPGSPDGERGQGGMIESALARFIEDHLNRSDKKQTPTQEGGL